MVRPRVCPVQLPAKVASVTPRGTEPDDTVVATPTNRRQNNRVIRTQRNDDRPVRRRAGTWYLDRYQVPIRVLEHEGARDVRSSDLPPATPRKGQMRFLVIAMCNVVGTVTGDSSLAHANVPHDGFEIKLLRAGPRSWRAVVRLARPGRWRLVVPNGTPHLGFMVPPPAA